jgi:hypothetical protein
MKLFSTIVVTIDHGTKQKPPVRIVVPYFALVLVLALIAFFLLPVIAFVFLVLAVWAGPAHAWRIMTVPFEVLGALPGLEVEVENPFGHRVTVQVVE